MKYLWPALNTCAIILMFFYIFTTKDINTQALDKIREFEVRLDERETFHPDTIIVNVNNFIRK